MITHCGDCPNGYNQNNNCRTDITKCNMFDGCRKCKKYPCQLSNCSWTSGACNLYEPKN